MTILDAAFWAVCLVLVASGATKLSEPQMFATALADLGLVPGAADGRPLGRRVASVVGAVEICVGLAALVLGGAVVAALAAAAYASFAVVVMMARRRGIGSCGCFGSRSGRPSATHAALNGGSAAVCVAAGVVGAAPIADGLEGLGIAAAAGVVICVLAVAAAIVVVDTR